MSLTPRKSCVSDCERTRYARSHGFQMSEMCCEHPQVPYWETAAGLVHGHHPNDIREAHLASKYKYRAIPNRYPPLVDEIWQIQKSRKFR